MPLNIRVGVMAIPILGMIGLCATTALLGVVIWTHPLGRVAGPGWILGWLAYYFWYRWKSGLPLFGSQKRPWEAEQMEILRSAEEFDLLEQYQLALAERDKPHANATP